MSRTNKIFQSIPVQIPDRSGFDLSHEVLTTAKTGTVVPVTHFEVLPGDTFSLGSMMKVTLPPFAVPFMGRIDAELTAAFIPYRLLWQGWQSFITQNNGINHAGWTGPGATIFEQTYGAATGVSGGVPPCVPRINLAATGNASYVGAGTLSNYLGYKTGTYVASSGDSCPVSALPFLAYHKFCDDWIRDENHMLPFFPKTVQYLNYRDNGDDDQEMEEGATGTDSGRFLPYLADGGFYGSVVDLSSKYFTLAPPDPYDNPVGIDYDQTLGLGSLRQRCWAKDYFTTATTRPQAGADSQVLFDITGETDENLAVTGSGGFTIATLRAANSLQKWLERNNIAGTEYGSQILAHFGVTPPDAVLNRSVLLGSVRQPVVVSNVENNAGSAQADGTKSPFGNIVGAAAGFGSSFDKGRLIDDFTAKEHGIIMVFFTLIPHAYYNTGMPRSFFHTLPGDFAWPEFAGIGDQPIFNAELTPGGPLQNIETWGYQQRYAEYKHHLDVVSGFLEDGQSLAAYALQRGFPSTDVPALGSSFLEIPTDYLDQVSGVSSALSGIGCMIDCYFDCSALRVLPEYSLPKL